MLKYSTVFAQIATWLIWFMILMGFALLVFVIPLNSDLFQSRWVEFRGDAITIQILTSLPVVFSMVSLLAITRLLSRIAYGGLHSTTTQRWVNILVGSSFSVGGSFIILSGWLTGQNAMAPLVVIVLIIGTAIAATVGFITLALKSVLIKATSDHNELEGLI
jgi:hypothetical protein